MNNTHPQTGAQFDAAGLLLLVHGLSLDDSAVLREARRWTSGVPAESIDDEPALAGVDVTAFTIEALTLGARALIATGQMVETRALERMVTDVGTQSSAAATMVTELTTRATKDAAESMATATDEAHKAITAADRTTRDELTAVVTTVDETRRLFAGDSPEPLEPAAKPLDPDPTSPIARARSPGGSPASSLAAPQRAQASAACSTSR